MAAADWLMDVVFTNVYRGGLRTRLRTKYTRFTRA